MSHTPPKGNHGLVAKFHINPYNWDHFDGVGPIFGGWDSSPERLKPAPSCPHITGGGRKRNLGI